MTKDRGNDDDPGEGEDNSGMKEATLRITQETETEIKPPGMTDNSHVNSGMLEVQKQVLTQSLRHFKDHFDYLC